MDRGQRPRSAGEGRTLYVGGQFSGIDGQCGEVRPGLAVDARELSPDIERGSLCLQSEDAALDRSSPGGPADPSYAESRYARSRNAILVAGALGEHEAVADGHQAHPADPGVEAQSSSGLRREHEKVAERRRSLRSGWFGGSTREHAALRDDERSERSLGEPRVPRQQLPRAERADRREADSGSSGHALERSREIDRLTGARERPDATPGHRRIPGKQCTRRRIEGCEPARSGPPVPRNEPPIRRCPLCRARAPTPPPIRAGGRARGLGFAWRVSNV